MGENKCVRFQIVCGGGGFLGLSSCQSRLVHEAGWFIVRVFTYVRKIWHVGRALKAVCE